MSEVDRLREALSETRETNRLLHRRTQEAESKAYRDAGRWKRRAEKSRQLMEVETRRRILLVEFARKVAEGIKKPANDL